MSNGIILLREQEIDILLFYYSTKLNPAGSQNFLWISLSENIIEHNFQQ